MMPSSVPGGEVGGTAGGCNLLAAGKHAREVIDGVRHRGARIGQRTDSHGKAWITPQIVHGGFSTGRHLAGGPAKPHELALASKHDIFPAPPRRVTINSWRTPTQRRAINTWCITHPEGRAWLLSLSRSGLYRLRTAEEGCLLAIVLIEESGVSADEIIEEVAPFFDLVRFFPEPADTPAPDGSVSSISNVRDLVARLAKRRSRFEHKYMATQRREADLELTYFPTYRAVVEEARRFCAWWSSEDRTSTTTTATSSDLKSKLLPLLTLRDTLLLLGFAKKMRRSSLWGLFDALKVASQHGSRTTRTFVQHMQRMVDQASAKQAKLAAARRLSSSSSSATTTTVQQRLRLSPHNQGFLVQIKGLIEELERIKSPEYGLPKVDVAAMTSRFPLFEVEIRRLTLGTLPELAAAGLLRSPGMLAKQAVSVVAAYKSTVAFATEPSRTLALHLLAAFLRRRSRLLLDLSAQVLVSELPWYKGLLAAFPQQSKRESEDDSGDDDDDDDDDEANGARHDDANNNNNNNNNKAAAVVNNPLAREVFLVHMAYFAGVQLPNPLVKLLRDHLECPGLVKEIAADIFVGAFRSDFGSQARQRKEILGPSSPYEVYYANALLEFPASEHLDVGDVNNIYVTTEDLGFTATGCGRSRPVENGIIIERVAVTTTHNLLRLLVAMGMDEDEELLEAAAGVALARLIEGLRSKSGHYRFLRDESRRSANACRAFMVLVSLLMKKTSGGEVPPPLLASLRENASAVGAGPGPGSGSGSVHGAATKTSKLSEEKALVLQGILSVVEGRGRTGAPLMGWTKSGQKHPVFFAPAPPQKKQKL